MSSKHEREIMAEVAPGQFLTASGFSMAREQDTLTPGGNPVAGRWVLRNPAGEYVDFDQYRHDLIERNGFRTSY